MNRYVNPLLNDPNKACIYVIKAKACWNEVLIAQRTHKTSLNRYTSIYIKYLQGRTNRGFSSPYLGSFLYNKEKRKIWMIEEIQVVGMSPPPLEPHNHSQTHLKLSGWLALQALFSAGLCTAKSLKTLWTQTLLSLESLTCRSSLRKWPNSLSKSDFRLK